jgi:hypothetical protein
MRKWKLMEIPVEQRERKGEENEDGNRLCNQERRGKSFNLCDCTQKNHH